MPKKKYANVLALNPSGFKDEWLMMMQPMNPKKNVSKNLTKFLFSIQCPPWY